ncbi:MAG: hypothetical protein NVS3B21_29060 [Acidimicrobiales bacterium]
MRQLLAAAGAVVALLGVLVGIVVGLITVWWIGVVVAVAIAACTIAGAWFGWIAPRVATAEARVLALVGPVRDAVLPTEARLLNLVEGLAPSAGVARPRCVVLDDPAPNALALGRNARYGCIVVTSGLLSSLSRMELEGVVARALVDIRDGTTAAPTVAVAVGGVQLLRHVAPPGPAVSTDLAAVGLTRYPPGLSAALRRLSAEALHTRPATSSPSLDPYWVIPAGDQQAVGVRAEALAEL